MAELGVGASGEGCFLFGSVLMPDELAAAIEMRLMDLAAQGVVLQVERSDGRRCTEWRLDYCDRTTEEPRDLCFVRVAHTTLQVVAYDWANMPDAQRRQFDHVVRELVNAAGETVNLQNALHPPPMARGNKRQTQHASPERARCKFPYAAFALIDAIMQQSQYMENGFTLELLHTSERPNEVWIEARAQGKSSSGDPLVAQCWRAATITLEEDRAGETTAILRAVGNEDPESWEILGGGQADEAEYLLTRMKYAHMWSLVIGIWWEGAVRRWWAALKEPNNLHRAEVARKEDAGRRAYPENRWAWEEHNLRGKSIGQILPEWTRRRDQANRGPVDDLKEVLEKVVGRKKPYK